MLAKHLSQSFFVACCLAKSIASAAEVQVIDLPPIDAPSTFSSLEGTTDFANEHVSNKTLHSKSGNIRVRANMPLMLTYSDIFNNPSACLKKLPTASLQCLILNNSTIQDADMSAVARFTHLKRLELAYTDITDRGLAKLAGLTELEYLDVSRTKITGTALASLSPLKQLKHLEMHGNNLEPSCLNSIKQFGKLYWLEVSQCHLRNPDLRPIGLHPSITTVEISDDPLINDKGLTEIKPLSKLTSINVVGTTVTAKGLLGLKGKHLTYMKVTKEKFTAGELRQIQAAFPGMLLAYDDCMNEAATLYHEVFEAKPKH